MTRLQRKLVVGGTLALFAALVVARELYAQVPVVKAKGKVLSVVEIIENSVPDATQVDVFTVPVDRRLVITDVTIANEDTAAEGEARIFRDGSATTAATAFISIPAGDSYEHTYATGLDFAPGQVVTVRNGSDGSGLLHFSLRGFLTTP